MLKPYSLGTGDRFGQEGLAQLNAVIKAKEEDAVTITPVWNKSHREHEIIGTGPRDVRREANEAVESLNWEEAYLVDADHITKEIVDPYVNYSDFFTIDVAEYIGEPAERKDRETFVQENREYVGPLAIPGISEEFTVTKDFLIEWADQYLLAIQEARDIFEHIRSQKENAVFEVSMDEVENPQSPIELFFILKTLADAGVRVDTIAPKFTGSFYKGVDYVGDIDQFVREFEQDILVITQAVEQFGLPDHLKLSIHSGSDKFSLYPHMHRLMNKHKVGIHLKTSGTTWLEELIGLVESGSKGEAMVKRIYRQAYQKIDELIAPYTSVVDIDREGLPDPREFGNMGRQLLVDKIEHNPQNAHFDSELRQFLHCSYKIAAEQDDFIPLLKANRDQIARRVTDNLFENHIKPLFIGE